MRLLTRNISISFFLLLCAACTFILFQGSSFADDKLIFMADENYRPYEFSDSQGQAQGFNVDIFRAVADVMGLEVRIESGEWHDIRSALEAGEIDGLTGMYYSQARDRKVDFTNSFITVRHSIFVRKNSNALKSLEDIRGKQIAVQQGDIMHDYVLKHDLTQKIIFAEDQAQALHLLASGKCDCALLAKLQGLYNLERLGIENVKAVGSPFSPRKYCFAVQQGNQ